MNPPKSVLKPFLCVFLLGAAAFAGVSTEIRKILPPGGNDSDLFGRSIAMHGSRLLVGAPGDGTVARNAGAAFVFDAVTGDFLMELSPPDHSRYDKLGTAVGASEEHFIVGAPFDRTGNHESGSAYVFDAQTGAPVSKLLPMVRDDGDNFGSAVAIDQGIAIVGAWARNDIGTQSGAAYLFDATTGIQTRKLISSGISSLDWFGYSVDISGPLCIVGARYENAPAYNSGAAYVFDVASGTQLRRLVASDGAALDLFGHTVALEGSIALVGAPGNWDFGTQDGAAYLFDLTTGAEIAQLRIPAGADSSGFGSSVAIAEGVAIVGADEVDGCAQNSGKVFLFEIPSGLFLGEIEAEDCQVQGGFGESVAGAGSLCAVGTSGDYTLGSQAGAAYTIDLTGGQLAASAISYNGTGINPALLVSASEPVLGGDWEITVDATGFPPSIVQVQVFDRSSQGSIVQGGELLVDTGSRRYLLDSFSHAGSLTQASFPLPGDGSLAGKTVFMQCAILGQTGGYQLTNGLEVKLGY